MNALNEVGKTHDVIYLWGHNHTGETSSDTSVYFVGVGGSLTPQGGSKGTINFTYMNAGYIKNGYCSMAVVNDDAVNVTRYNTSGSVTASYTHVDSDGYRIYTCGTCGHSYSEKLSLTYSQVSSFASGERFVITVKSGSKYYALSHSGNNIAAVQVTVSDGRIISDITEDLLWTYENGKLTYENEVKTYYLYTYSSGWWWTSASLGISSGESGAISLRSGKLKIGSTYLRYASGKFSVSSSGTTVYLFQEK